MPRNEHLTRIELIDPTLYELGWTGALIREEKTPGGSDHRRAPSEAVRAHGLPALLAYSAR